MLEHKYVDAAPKFHYYNGYNYNKYWGLYGPTYKLQDGIWIDYIQ